MTLDMEYFRVMQKAPAGITLTMLVDTNDPKPSDRPIQWHRLEIDNSAILSYSMNQDENPLQHNSLYMFINVDHVVAWRINIVFGEQWDGWIMDKDKVDVMIAMK